MIGIFERILKNKNFIVWLILFSFILYKTFDMIFYIKLYIMQENEITNNIYLFYSFMFPLAFSNNSLIFSAVADLAYLIIISYVVVNYVDYFLLTSKASTITRVDRKQFIKELTLINIVFSLIMFIIYLIAYFILTSTFEINITISFSIIIPIILKLLLTILIPNIYLYFFIKTDNLLITTGFLLIIYVLDNIFLGLLFNNVTLTFNYVYLIILLLILINIFMYKSIVNSFIRRDV